MNFELKNHIKYEFITGRDNPTRLLYEVRGVVNNIDKIISKIESECINQIESTINTKKGYFKIYHIDFNGENFFFKELYLSLTTYYDDRNTYGGSTSSDSVVKKQGNIICQPIIELQLYCNSVENMVYKLKFCLGHELTHVHNMYQYVLKTGKDLYSNMVNVQKYKEISNLKDNLYYFKYINQKVIGDVLYRLNRMERNAYIAQLRQELLQKKEEIKDSKTAYETLISTDSYKKNYLYLQKVIFLLVNLTDENAKKDLVKIMNNFSKRKITNYNDVKKYFVNRWNKWKKQYMIKASKIVYDVFNENGPIYLVNKPDNDTNLTL